MAGPGCIRPVPVAVTQRGKVDAVHALVLDKGLTIREVAEPVPGPGEALIRVRLAGVCNTDLELAKGYMGFCGTLGHEFVGEVVASPSPAWVGRRVVGEINCVCHRCAYCQRHMPHHCLNRTVLGIQGRDGAFADFVVLPVENLHAVPDHVPDDEAVFTEPLAAAFRILEQAAIGEFDRVIVLGDGKLGLLIAQVLALRSRSVLCVGRHGSKLALLAECGIETALEGTPVAPGADVVVDASGSADGLARALEWVRPEGTVVLKTTVAGQHQLALSLPVIHEVRIVGSRCGPFPPALEALAAGTVRVRPLIAEQYPLADGVRALERAATPGVLKVLVQTAA